jgi:hypothetical protein
MELSRYRYAVLQFFVCSILLVTANMPLQPDSGAALPAACARKDFTSTGQPVFGIDGKALIGISMKRDSFRKGERITVNSWVANPAGRPIGWSRSCMPYADVAVYDLQGHEIVSVHQQTQRERKQTGDQTVDLCTLSFPVVTVEPRICMTPDDLGATDEFIDYVLEPGRYIVTPVPYPKGPRPGQGLMITITE